MISPLWLPDCFSGYSASQLWLAVMNWAKWLNFLGYLIKIWCFQNQLDSFHLILEWSFVSDGKKYLFYLGFSFQCFCLSLLFWGWIFTVFVHWKNHQRFFWMIGKYISQLLNLLILYSRKSLVTRTLFALFSHFSLAFFMFSVGENAWEEYYKWNLIHYWRKKAILPVLISFEKSGFRSEEFFHIFCAFFI